MRETKNAPVKVFAFAFSCTQPTRKHDLLFGLPNASLVTTVLAQWRSHFACNIKIAFLFAARTKSSVHFHFICDDNVVWVNKNGYDFASFSFFPRGDKQLCKMVYKATTLLLYCPPLFRKKAKINHNIKRPRSQISISGLLLLLLERTAFELQKSKPSFFLGYIEEAFFNAQDRIDPRHVAIVCLQTKVFCNWKVPSSQRIG